MKHIMIVVALVIGTSAIAQQHKLTKIWETDSILAIPESVLPDYKNQLLYVSLIDGGGWISDGKGEIAKISMDGKTIDSTWITGLNAPKGLGRMDNLLYVADNSEVVVVDIEKGVVRKKIQIPGAKGLNDITVDRKGAAVYVSDSRTAKIWKIVNDQPSLYMDNIKGGNGLKFIKGDLIFAEGKALMKAGGQKKVTKIAEVTAGIDGIEPIGNGDFLVTGWSGYLYYVYANGKFETLLDTRAEKKNAADIGYDKKNKIVYIPSFNGKTVAAYQLH